MIRRLSLCVLACMMVMLSGCACLLTRGDWGYLSPGKPTQFYPATAMDCEFIYSIFTVPLQKEDWFIDLPCRPIFGALTIVDAVPSIALDTVLFPWDLAEVVSAGTKNKGD